MSHPEKQYLDLMSEVFNFGHYREGRNGGTYGLFGRQIRFDLQQGFPLLTTKRIHIKSVVAELLWFLSGSTNVKPLQEQGVTIWDEWADENGELGPVYGKQWRSWPTAKFTEEHGQDDFMGTDYTICTPMVIDQIQNLIEGLKKDPYGRRHIVSAWNPAEIPDMALPPCHCLFQFFVADGKLSCQLYQRSADTFLGVPFNIASYALLVHLVAREVGLEVGDFVHTFGDIHVYANHAEAVATQLVREPRPFPKLVISPDAGGIFEVKTSDISFEDYNPHPTIRAEVSA